MKFATIFAILCFAGISFGSPRGLFHNARKAKRSSDLISWSSVSSDIESILETDFADYIDQSADSVSKSVTTSFFEKVLDSFFASSPTCQDTFLIDYTTSNFYNHLITFTDGNIALTIQYTIDSFDMETPEDFQDALETLDETLQEPVHDLLDVLDDLELDPAWEMTKELRGYMHSNEAAGLTYKQAMLAATEKIVKWFEENVDKCSADESTYGQIASAMVDDAVEMSQDATQTVIDNVMDADFAKMDTADVQMINISLMKAKMMRNLIWTKLKGAMEAGRATTQTTASKSIGAVLHAGGANARKRHAKKTAKKTANSESRQLLRELINALQKLK